MRVMFTKVISYDLNRQTPLFKAEAAFRYGGCCYYYRSESTIPFYCMLILFPRISVLWRYIVVGEGDSRMGNLWLTSAYCSL
jgi:hypothetical protein